MKPFTRVRKSLIFAALVLALMLSGAFLSPGSGGWARVIGAKSAYPMYSKEITYYNDAAHTQQVGTGMIYCNGRGTLTGTSSPYYTEEIIDVCCGSVPC